MSIFGANEFRNYRENFSRKIRTTFKNVLLLSETFNISGRGTYLCNRVSFKNRIINKFNTILTRKTFTKISRFGAL